MPSSATLKIVAAGFLMSVLVWSLIPDAADEMNASDWAELPEDFSSEDALAILDAQSDKAEIEWRRATGKNSPEIEALDKPIEPAN
ncbi:hypothetical protein [Amaricoccus macauensis]|uniref:hypothetical protein n=1 Tax=Amaricoccus macauensis TaxID=57001 RepID=UPI003C7BC1CC